MLQERLLQVPRLRWRESERPEEPSFVPPVGMIIGALAVVARLPFLVVFGACLATNWCHFLAERMLECDPHERSDLKELNEHNFARFDAKLEQRLAESDAKWERRVGQLTVDLHREIAKAKTELLAWSGALWLSVGLAIVGLYFRT